MSIVGKTCFFVVLSGTQSETWPIFRNIISYCTTVDLITLVCGCGQWEQEIMSAFKPDGLKYGELIL